MATYAHTLFGKPVPRHAQTDAAEAARQSVRDFAARRKAQAAEPELVTDAARPVWQRIAYTELTGSPAGFAKAALEAGHVVECWRAGDAIEVRVANGRIRAWWKAGHTTGALVDGKRANATQAKAAL